MQELYVLYRIKIILLIFLRPKHGIKIYIFLIYFLIDFDMERKLRTFFITIIIFFKQREKGIVTTNDTDH